MRSPSRALTLALIAALAPACDSAPTPPAQTPPVVGAGPTVLMFVAYNRVWWSEYKVLYEGLRAAGYDVDVRSSATGTATSYQSDGDVQSSANGAAGSTYGAFQAAFAADFGAPWNAAWNAPAAIPLNGRLQDVASMAGYVALAIPGGVGAVDYRYDGAYADTIDGAHVSVAADVQAAAEKLNALMVEALQSDKPVLAECHGATLPVFARVPGSAGQMPAPDALGRSMLQNRTLTGFPLNTGDTAAVCASFGVTYLGNRPAVVDGAALSSRDWYPQTVAHAGRTLLNRLGTTPGAASLAAPVGVLILHGGPCDPASPNNDIPANYGTSPASVIPVDYLDLTALLTAPSAQDPYAISVTDVNLLGGALPFNLNSSASMLAYFSTFDVVLVFKHWSTSFPAALQTALRDYADAGGGVVALHHALFNDGGGKNILCGMFGAESSSAGWSARNPDIGPYTLMSTNYGHFVSTHGVTYGASAVVPPGGFAGSPSPANPMPGGYPAFAITDEIYNNMAFIGTPSFGRGAGQIELLFANDYVASAGQVHTSGFVKRYDGNGDGVAGRLVFLQPGERVVNMATTMPYGQVVRNAVVWASQR